MPELVRKDYYCSACKAKHVIDLPASLAKGRESYPFSHVFLHKLERSDVIDEVGLDILTTLYIDANMSIRGVEVKKLAAGGIMSTEDSAAIATKLVEEIARLQDEVVKLQAEVNSLKQARS